MPVSMPTAGGAMDQPARTMEALAVAEWASNDELAAAAADRRRQETEG
jgi:hypothetical protein